MSYGQYCWPARRTGIQHKDSSRLRIRTVDHGSYENLTSVYLYASIYLPTYPSICYLLSVDLSIYLRKCVCIYIYIYHARIHAYTDTGPALAHLVNQKRGLSCPAISRPAALRASMLALTGSREKAVFLETFSSWGLYSTNKACTSKAPKTMALRRFVLTAFILRYFGGGAKARSRDQAPYQICVRDSG